MRNWHDTERFRAAVEQQAKATAAPSIIGNSKRTGGRRRGGRGEGGREERWKKGAGGESVRRHAQETEVWVWPSSS